MPANVLLPNNMPSLSTPSSHTDYFAQLTQKLQSAFGSAAWNRDCAHNQQKRQYDKSVRHTPYAPGEHVWLNDPTTSKQKLSPHWKGLGSDVDSPGVTYRIHYLLDQSDKSQIVHYNRPRPYKAPVPERGHKCRVFICSQVKQLHCLFFGTVTYFSLIKGRKGRKSL